jgi:hypothetical protein
MKKFFYILLIISFAGCKGKDGSTETGRINIVIDTDNARKVDISEYVDSVKYIKLQTTDDNLVGSINKVFFVDNRILVTDSKVSQILIFDTDGKFLNKIKKIGTGPGEYTGIAASFFDPASNSIIIYNSKLRKMLFFSLDGEFLKEIHKFNDNALIRTMINLPNGNFLCYTYDLTPKQVGEEASGLWEVDSLGNFVRSFFTITDLYPVIYNQDNSPLTLLPDGKISVMDVIWGNIYHFESDSLREYISYEVKGNSLKSLKGNSYSKEQYTSCYTSQDKGGYIFTSWYEVGKNNSYMTVYSKKDNKNVLIYPEKMFWSKQTFVMPHGELLIDSNNFDALVTSITGDVIFDFLKENNASDKTKADLNGLIKGMNESERMDMNPVLQLLYIKK